MNLENPQILILLTPILFVIGFIFKKDIDKNKIKKITLFSIRSLIIILLIIAVAQPFVLKEKVSETKKQVVFLSDNSKSFQLFESEEIELLLEKLSQQKFKKIEFGTEITTELAESIAKVAKDSSLIMLSDGNNNIGNVNQEIQNAANRNVTMIAIKPIQTKKDVSTSIEGPHKTFEESETEFTIKIKGKEKAEIKKFSWIVDGQKREEILNIGESEKTIKENFKLGRHTLVAEIENKDYFTDNNKDTKEIIAEQKPKILLLGNKEFYWLKNTKEYELIKQKEVPIELKKYNTIIFNDLKELSESETKRIREYLLNGGGIIVIGGKNSLEYGSYENELIEDLLPVKVGLTNKKESKYNIVVLIDISSSTGTEQEGIRKVEIEKAQAINIINKLKPKNKIGAIAFNTQAFKISEIDLVERNKDKIVSNISSLQSGGGTMISEGLNSAIEELKKAEGNKLIVLISDGKTQDYEKTLESAQNAQKEGMKIFTIGTGNDEIEKLKEIAEITNGEYILADKTKTASLLYNKFSENKDFELTIANKEHFITKNTTANGKIKGMNNVIAKSSATTLMRAGENDLLVAWNFGNGRSALIATGEEFARELFEKEQNDEIIKRTVSWAAAQIEDKKEFAGESTELKENELNEEFFNTIKERGGKVISPKEFIQNEIDKIKEETKKEMIKEKKYYSSFFIEAAVLLFCLEIALRKFVFDTL